ncbi:MAG: ATP-binding protein [Candidatus Brocadiia bacterium]
MIITIASGKGGTGKTTVAANLATVLAASAEVHGPVRLLDCDVEEPNDHLFVRPRFDRTEPVRVLKPVWDQDKCTGCGRCAEVCNYNALAVVKERVLFFPELCHACGACSFICPEGAMREELTRIGQVAEGRAEAGFAFGHGLLDVGESLAPDVVEAVKEQIEPDGITVIDASPGTACPVVEAVRGADVALLVTEPTPFGLNDLKLAVGLALKVGVPAGIVVNRSDGEDKLIQDYADEVGVPVVGRVPYRRAYAETYSRGDLLVDHHAELRSLLMDIYRRTMTVAAGPPQPVPHEQQRIEPTRALETGEQAGPRSELTVISGKGGTGKTTVTASLASLLDDRVLADADVDAADMHLLLQPQVVEARDFVGGWSARIVSDQCTACGRCAELCHFDAIEPVTEQGGSGPSHYQVNELLCEGCGLCRYVCPVDAIDVSAAVTGQRFVSRTPYGLLSHARLGIAEENSGKLVTAVRGRAQDLTGPAAGMRIVADGSPGTGCPVIASISGVDTALIVTEPTVSGVHDLERVLELVEHFRVRPLICINKCDLNAEQAERIRRLARERGAEVVGEIPFDEEVNRTLMAGQILSEGGEGPAAEAVRDLAITLERALQQATQTT